LLCSYESGRIIFRQSVVARAGVNSAPTFVDY
jgi:hypothetical protein